MCMKVGTFVEPRYLRDIDFGFNVKKHEERELASRLEIKYIAFV